MVIWVVFDRLSKSAHFIALPMSFATTHLANLFSVEICRLHGVPKSIISDCDPVFQSHFWKELFHLQDTKLKFSMVYHPQTDGQIEVINCCLEAYLRCFTNGNPRTWYRYLHLAKFWYNSSYHSAIKTTPFQALYGRSPPSIPDYVPGITQKPTLDITPHDRTRMLHQLKATLKTTQQQMTESENKSRLNYNFKENDWVLLQCQTYRQTSLSSKAHNKLGQRFFGPYRIKRRIGEVVYELFLPPSSRIHPVFHIFLLKLYHDSTPPSDFHFPLEPKYPPVPTHDLLTLFPNLTLHSETSNIPFNSLNTNPPNTLTKSASADTWHPSTVHAPLKLSPSSSARDLALPQAHPIVTHSPKLPLSNSHPAAKHSPNHAFSHFELARDTPFSNTHPIGIHSPKLPLSNCHLAAKHAFT